MRAMSGRASITTRGRKSLGVNSESDWTLATPSSTPFRSQIASRPSRPTRKLLSEVAVSRVPEADAAKSLSGIESEGANRGIRRERIQLRVSEPDQRLDVDRSNWRAIRRDLISHLNRAGDHCMLA